MDYKDFFKAKKITVMGLGLLGGIGDIRFLAEQGADLIVTDLKPEADAAASLEALREFPNIRYTLGHHDLADFRDRDLIIMAPATPRDSPFIAEARAAGIHITMWAALFSKFAREAGATIVGVTGTRGKTTMTSLLADILRSAGRRIIEGGNLRGTSLLSRLSELQDDAVVVLELDSWKLQGFGEENISPNVSVFTNFMSDHQNYYKGDMEAYFADKANIFKYQKDGDTLVVGRELWEERRKDIEGKTKARIVVADVANVPKDLKISIPGEHNRKNIACAIEAARALGVGKEAIRSAVESFTGVEGRLELVREHNGIKIYNDTTATTPDATIAALEALDPEGKKNIVLIMGGADKGLDMSGMRPAIHTHCKKVFLLAGTGTEKIRADAPDVPVFQSLQPAVEAALAASATGDILLFSPAFASFGLFKNEYDRGEQFLRLVREI